MNAQTAFAQRLFAILWDKARAEDYSEAEHDLETVALWLEHMAWPTLFPDHCFTCHMNEHDRCEEHDPFDCLGCMKEEQEHQLAVLQAKMGRNEDTWKILKDNEPLTKKQAEDILNGKPIEEMKRLKNDE